MQILDMCAFGARWRKHTRIVGWNISEGAPTVSRACSGHKGICSFIQKQHFVLEGPKNTLLAQVYPWRLSYNIADILIASMRQCHMTAMLS
eukprot:2091930-Heterocapsa_arctica.AAC.1